MNRTLHLTMTKEYPSIFSYFDDMALPKRLRTQIKANNLTKLDGDFVALRSPISRGQVLEITILEDAPSDIVATPMNLPILFEDEDILVIDKPARLPVHPSIRHYEDTLANGLMDYYKMESSPFVFRCINRLDRDTSGVILIAKNPLSGALLQRAVKDRQIHRTYLSIVEGQLPASGTIDAPIARVQDSVILRQVDRENGQQAITHYQRLAYKNGYSLASIKLETGRTHQIRVHMKSIGHPLPGDFLYNPDNTAIGRQALHSHSLSFHHPITGEELNFSSPLPADMEALLI